MGYKAIVIFGNPDNYVSRGFKSCKKFQVCVEGDIFPAALLVKELQKDFFDGRTYYFHESSVFEIDESAAEEFDKGLNIKKRHGSQVRKNFIFTAILY